MEVWKPVAGLEGDYEISSLGRVYSLLSNKFLKPGIASHGYPTVSLKRKTRTVHSLVMEAFIGPRPLGHCICHGNGDRKDPRLENLRYGTFKENVSDTEAHGKRIKGTMYKTAKLTEETARIVRGLKGKLSQKQLSILYGVSPAAIQAVQDGRTWKHV